MALIQFNTSNFKKEVLESKLPVLVDFWAPWCGPCKMISPIIEELALEYKDKFKIGKVNIEEDPKIATSFGIMSIPTLIFLKNGKVMEQIVGAVNRGELKKKIEAHL
jgi:thioredoxin 1